MKIKSILYFLLLLIVSPLYSQWQDLSISTSHSFSSVDFIDDHTGFVAGGREIYKTSDGGFDWILVYSADTFVYLEEVVMLNDNIVLAVGKDFLENKTIILRSYDSGLSWIAIDNDFNTLLRSLYFIDDSTGYAVGHANYIYKTIDSGLSWEQMALPVSTNIFYESVFFSNPMNGHVVGGLPGKSKYARTTDGGGHWEEIIIDSDNYFQSVFFLDTLRGYIVGWNGEILVTGDGGDSWTHQSSVNMDGNLQILFTNDSTGYIVGGMVNDGSIQKTMDNGNQWMEIGPDIVRGLVAVDFPSENIGYVVGSTGTIFKTINGGVTSISGFEKENKLSIYPNPVHDQLFFHSNLLITDIRLLSSNGSILESVTVSTNNYNMNVNNLPAGNYYLFVRAGASSGIYPIVVVS